MREMEKEEDSAQEERRVTGCQPRMQSIFGRIKGTVRDFNSYKLMPAYSAPLTAAVHETAEIPDIKYVCKWAISTCIL